MGFGVGEGSKAAFSHLKFLFALAGKLQSRSTETFIIG
jgi:hypothetical protein